MRIRTTGHVLVVCVLLTALAAPGVSRAGAEMPSRDTSARLDRFMAEYAEQLGLDQQTLATLRPLVEASRAQAETLRVELRQAYAQMRALLSQEVPSEAAVSDGTYAPLAAGWCVLLVLWAAEKWLTPAPVVRKLPRAEAWVR